MGTIYELRELLNCIFQIYLPQFRMRIMPEDTQKMKRKARIKNFIKQR